MEPNTFYNAVVRNDFIELPRILRKSGVDVNQVFHDGSTALQLAVIRNNPGMVDLLLKRGATPDFANPSLMAALKSNYEMVKLFLTNTRGIQRENSENTFLRQVVLFKNVRMTEILLSHGADPNFKDRNGFTPFYFYLKYLPDANSALLSLFLKNGARLDLKDNYGRNALHLAAQFSSCETLKTLLELRIPNVIDECDNEGRSVLHFVAYSNQSEVEVVQKAKLLAEHGAEIGSVANNSETTLYTAVTLRRYKLAEYLINLRIDVNGSDRLRPIFAALKMRDYKMFELLVNRGARFDVRDDRGRNVFYCVMLEKDLEQIMQYKAVKLLLDKGIDINECFEGGRTPLHMAISNSDSSLAHLLIDRGASLNIKDKCGKSPLYLAAFYELSEIAETLINKGADVNDVNSVGTSILDAAFPTDYSCDSTLTNLLLNAGAKFTEQMILTAAAFVDPDILDTLLKNGADCRSKLFAHQLLYEAMGRNKRPETVELLVLKWDVIDADEKFEGSLPLYYDDYYGIDKIFLKKIAILEAQNMFVHEINLKIIKSDKTLLRTYESYKEELEQMKTMKVCPEYNVTYFDVLTKRNMALVRCMRLEQIEEVLADYGNYEKPLPCFGKTVLHKYDLGLRLKEDVDKFVSRLQEIFGNIFPDDVIVLIGEYFNFRDFQLLIKS